MKIRNVTLKWHGAVRQGRAEQKPPEVWQITSGEFLAVKMIDDNMHYMGECFHCERLKSQNRISTELQADWQSWWSCRQLPLPINSCYEAFCVFVCVQLGTGTQTVGTRRLSTVMVRY